MIPAEGARDLHGNVPEDCPAVLLIIDMINDLEFEGGGDLFEYVLSAARNIQALKRKARQAGLPVLYLNDNFGKWRSDRKVLVRHCLTDGVRGEPIVKLLAPEPDDYFVLKPNI